MRHGRGTLFYPNGDKFKGEYKENVREGRGVCYYADGDRFKGSKDFFLVIIFKTR